MIDSVLHGFPFLQHFVICVFRFFLDTLEFSAFSPLNVHFEKFHLI